jgi:Zn-dependent peptidase ImmA (M78 family)/DNA-binding XRE family transcriptional regulator
MSIGERLRIARIAEKLSMRALADEVDISAMAISKYERDLMAPSSGVLLQLADALGVRVEYFFRPSVVNVELKAYRKHKKLAVKEERALLARIEEWLERFIEAEDLFPQSRPSLRFQQSVSSIEEVERVANEIRELWQLGQAPIENLIQVLEDHGVAVGLVEGFEPFDACTFSANGMHVIVVKKDIPGDRQRYNLAHELGHLVLEVKEVVDEEKAAHRFAGAFLVPSSAARRELGSDRSTLSPGELHILKHKYGLSMQAWIYRAQDLEIISRSTASELFREFRVRGWNREEPGESYPPEEPARLRRNVFHALAENMISRSRAEELLGETIESVPAWIEQGDEIAFDLGR